MKILIGAVISQHPYSPGMAWNWMHLAIGLQRLGHDVYYLEEVDPAWCVDLHGQVCPFERSVNRDLFHATMERFGLGERACQIYDGARAMSGLSLSAVIALARDADLIINMSGHIKAEIILSNVQRRVYIDQDPVYTQLWHAEYGKDLNFKKHDVFFPVGLNIGTPYTSIPDCGLPWFHTLPPVVLEYWPVRRVPSGSRFTTVASWGGFSDLCFRGEWYRSKYEEFKHFAGLPQRVHQELEIALNSYPEEETGVQLLRNNGWFLTQARRIGDLGAYQEYIRRSRAEIGIAKNAYVKGCSGWFSDRTAHYLASGRPALVQSTGFERCLPTGQGLLTFGNLEEAVEGIEMINGDYEVHCRAAREFAEEYLDYRRVLPKMLELATAC